MKPAFIEAYEKASVKEMTVNEVYNVIYESLLLDPRGCADNLETDAKIITDALAKLGTIRIVGGGE